ncbi:hypothetical protein RS9916_37792 [Synechococcus sp. RS9916]|nr:hypothetical protein RS9916_37792 [Synechococcus sp. RS9916]
MRKLIILVALATITLQPDAKAKEIIVDVVGINVAKANCETRKIMITDEDMADVFQRPVGVWLTIEEINATTGGPKIAFDTYTDGKCD